MEENHNATMSLSALEMDLIGQSVMAEGMAYYQTRGAANEHGAAVQDESRPENITLVMPGPVCAYPPKHSETFHVDYLHKDITETSAASSSALHNYDDQEINDCDAITHDGAYNLLSQPLVTWDLGEHFDS